jgi:predicted nucleic acid-binding protein
MEQIANKVLIDADVIFHLLVTDSFDKISAILFPYKCIVIDLVYEEVCRKPLCKSLLDTHIKSKNIFIENFDDNDIEIKKEYAFLKRKPLLGQGEIACMACAKFKGNTIASSNFRDTKQYCIEHKIPLIGTLDILYISLHKKIFSIDQCDEIIRNAIQYNKALFPESVMRSKQISYYKPDEYSLKSIRLFI